MNIPLQILPDGREISRLGFGASSFWAKSQFDERRAIEVAVHARQAGISYFDTGPSYARGEAEIRLGKAISAFDGMSFVISSKFGTHNSSKSGLYKDFSPDLLRSSVHGSLRRLSIEKLDILLLHAPLVSDLSDRLLMELQKLKDDGDILWSGVYSSDAAVIEHSLGLPFDAVMVQFNVFDQGMAALARAHSESGRIVINATTLGQGIFHLTNFVPKNIPAIWYLLRILRNNPNFIAQSLKFRRLCGQLGLSPVEAAIGFALSEKALTAAVFGSTRIENVVENVRASHLDYSGVDFSPLREAFGVK